VVTTVSVRANRVPRNAHHRIALLIAEVFVGHDGGIATLLAATVRLDPKVLHDAMLRLAATRFAAAGANVATRPSPYLDRGVANIGAPAIS
jgi:hypothetical protein